MILILKKKKVIKDNERVDTNFIGVNPKLIPKGVPTHNLLRIKYQLSVRISYTI